MSANCADPVPSASRGEGRYFPAMRSVQSLKLAMAAVGLAAFFLGVKMQNEVVRWTGIGLVAAAFLLRFVRPRQ